MKAIATAVAAIFVGTLFSLASVEEASAQFRGFWLDIGEYHHVYSEGGARQEEAPGIPQGMNYPAITRESSHDWARALWVGVKDWTDERGQHHPYFVGRIGPRSPGIEVTSPVDTRIIARYEDSVVEVDEALSFAKVAVVDEVDPSLPADRMVENVHNMRVGVTATHRMFAYVNQYHDNYHIIESEYCNTGNIDGDPEIELDGQTLNDVFFFRINRWRGNAAEGWQASHAQTWGKFSMMDVVGDGHAEYDVDFTAYYFWPGYDPNFTRYNILGGPLIDGTPWVIAPGDSVGRIAGGAMPARGFLHIDNSPNDPTYIKCTPATAANCQPHTLGFMDQDAPETSDGMSHEDYYELGILTRENPSRFPGGHSRMFPHYADRIEPTGEFWNPKNDASQGKQGGHAPTEAIGPYQMAFGDCVSSTVVEGVGGLSYDARVQIGRAYKRLGTNEDALIPYDADGDGAINDAPFNYDIVGLPQYQGNGCTDCPRQGSELQTKNQWVMSARDSAFQFIFRARDLWESSNGMTTYPSIPEPPLPPVRFTVDSRPNQIELRWEPMAGGPPIDRWEVYRAADFEDNLLDPDGNGEYAYTSESWAFDGRVLVNGYECIAGCPGTPPLSEGSTSFNDATAVRGTDYFYYVVAIGKPQPADPLAINGTPNGAPLRSGRYFSQTYQPATLTRPPYGQTSTAAGDVRDARIVPNPVNLGAETGVRFSFEDRVAFFNVPGEATIKIFSETGELIHEIEHLAGSGDVTWNLTTASRQLLVSGIYIAVIEDHNPPSGSPSTAFLKFTVIR